MRFASLWESHPTVASRLDDAPCKKNGKRAFENQCAIRLGEALRKAGVSLESFKGARCWHGHQPSHILRAEELANWLSGPFSPLRRKLVFDGVNGFDKIAGKRGVIFFKDYYGPNRQGDHIDLWNGSRLTRLSSWLQFALQDGRHYRDATVWFWPIGD